MSNTNQQNDPVMVLREQLRLKRQKIVEKLAEVDKDLESTENVIRLLGHKEPHTPEEPFTVPAKELHGLTQLEALIYIAKKNNNRVKVTAATRLLASAGLLTGSKKNWYNILTTIIKRSEKFNRVGPGEYELLLEERGGVVLMRKAPVA